MLFRRNSEGDVRAYRPLGLHIHTPSEHTINGKLLDAELHIVHTDDDGNLAVVGIFFDRYAGYYDNDFIETVFDAFETRDEAEGSENKKAVDLTKLLNYGLDTRHIWQYEGSLTTPPCTEGVAWNVIA